MKIGDRVRLDPREDWFGSLKCRQLADSGLVGEVVLMSYSSVKVKFPSGLGEVAVGVYQVVPEHWHEPPCLVWIDPADVTPEMVTNGEIYLTLGKYLWIVTDVEPGLRIGWHIGYADGGEVDLPNKNRDSLFRWKK